MLSRRRLFAACLLAPLPIAAWPARRASAAATLRLGYFDFPPYTHTDPDGSPGGTLVDQLRQVTARSGDSFTAQKLPPARVVAGMVDGSVDLCLLPNTFPQWQGGKVLSTAKPINRVTVEAFSLAVHLSGEGDLAGRSIIVQQGYGYGGMLDRLKQAGATVAAEVKSADAGVQALAAGRGEVLLHYRPEIDRVLRASPPLPGPLSRVVLSDAVIHINLAAAAPEARAAMARFDAAIAALPDLLAPPPA